MSSPARLSREVRRPASAQTRGGVVVVHPGRQHSYQVALAAQETGVLRAFATGVAPRSTALHGVARRLAATKAGRPLLPVANRHLPGIEPSNVVTFPTAYLPAKVAGRIADRLSHRLNLEPLASRNTDRAIGRWLGGLDPAPALVHGFESNSLATFRAARKVGATTVLDVASAFELLGRVRQLRYDKQAERVGGERELADWVLAPSDAVIACLTEGGVDPARIVRLPYGTAPPSGPRAARDDATFRVVFVGRVDAGKGIAYLLEAWRRLALANAELVVVGPITHSGRPLVAGLPRNVRLTGKVGSDGVESALAAGDVFAFPSLAEGSAISTYEAMAAGLPLITTSESGSVARDGIEGIVVPSRDANAIAEALQRLFDDRELASSMGAAARERIADSFTWAHYRARLARLYQALLDGERPPLLSE